MVEIVDYLKQQMRCMGNLMSVILQSPPLPILDRTNSNKSTIERRPNLPAAMNHFSDDAFDPSC